MSLRKSDTKEIEDIIGSIKQNFECPICLELMLNPVSTKCDHKFCRHCILKVIGRKPSTPCPLCKAPVTKRSLQDLVEWKNFVGKVKQLVDAFKLDLAEEEEVTKECRESAKEAGVPTPSPGKPSVVYVHQGATSTTHQVRKRRSVRFRLEDEELNSRQDEEDAEVEQTSSGAGSNSTGVKCRESIEILSTTNKMSSVTSGVSKQTSCRRNDFVEVESNASVKCNATEVEASDEEDDDNRGLITGGYQVEVGVDMEMRLITENRKIFKSRALSKEVRPVEEKSRVDQSVDDPFAFIGSQPTPKRKKSVQKQVKDVDGIHMFEDFNVLPKRRKRMSLRERSELRLPADKKHAAEAKEPTADEHCFEIQAISDKLSDAENYNLVLSQQFRSSDAENMRNQKRMEHSRAKRNLVSADSKILPLALAENRDHMQKSGSILMQKDDEEVLVLPLTAGETTKSKMVPHEMTPNETSPNHTAPNHTTSNETSPSHTSPNHTALNHTAPNETSLNHTAPEKAIPKIRAPNRPKPKVNEIEQSETVPNKIPNRAKPIRASTKEAFKMEAIPNKLMPSKAVPSEMVPDETAPEQMAPNPNTEKNIGSYLERTGTSPNTEVLVSPLIAGEVMKNRMVTHKMAPNESSPNEISPNHAAPEKTVPKVTAPNRPTPKVNEIEPSETIPSKIRNRAIPIKALPKEVSTMEVIPNKLMPSKAMVADETAPKNTAPSPNVDKSIESYLERTRTSPTTDVSFRADSGSNSGTSKVCEADNYGHSSNQTGVEENAVCMLEPDGNVTVLCSDKPSKRRKCSELVPETNDDSFASRNLPKTRSSSRKRSPFQTVETKWQKKYQRKVSARDERKKAIEEFNRLQDVPTSNRCAASTSDSGLIQNKSPMDSESITLIDDDQVQCLEEEISAGEREEQPRGEESGEGEEQPRGEESGGGGEQSRGEESGGGGEQPRGKESAGGLGTQPMKEQKKIDRLEEQSSTVAVAVESSSQSSISCVPDSVENEVEGNQCFEEVGEAVQGKSETYPMLQTFTENIDETFECKIVKETLKSDRLFSENLGSDVVYTESGATPLGLPQMVAVLENSGEVDGVPIRENECKNAAVVPEDVVHKPKEKRKTLSLGASPSLAGEKMLCVSESTLSEGSRTTGNISAEESQPRDSMAAPADFLLKPKAKRKRKTFSLEASPPRTEQKMNNCSSLQTDSIDFEAVIGEAVLGMLGKADDRADDDLSTQEIEMHEAVWKSGQTAKRNGCAVGVATSAVANSQRVPAVVKTGAKLVHETESGNTGVTEENGIKDRVTVEAVNYDEVVALGNGAALRDRCYSECVEDGSECAKTFIKSSCAKEETQSDRKSECIAVGTYDSSSSVHSNSYSLLQPPPPPLCMAQNENRANLHLKDSTVTVQHSVNSQQSVCPNTGGVCLDTGRESLPDVESEHFVESEILIGLRSDELKVDSKPKSQLDISSNNKIDGVDAETAKVGADLGNRSELQSDLVLVMESVPETDSSLGLHLITVNEQKNLGGESSDIQKSLEDPAHQLSSTCEPTCQTEEIDIQKSLEDPAHQLSSTCEPTCQTEEIDARSPKGVIQDSKKIEVPMAFVNVAEKNESDDSDDEVMSPVGRINLTSSGNLSSESEMLTTQQRHDLEVEVKTMEEEIARLQAELTNEVKTLTDKIDVPVVTSEMRDSEQEAKKPDLPASPGQNGLNPNTCDSFEEGIIGEKPESDGVIVVLDSSNAVSSDRTTVGGVVDDLKTELRQCQSTVEDVDESSSEADLFGSQMSDIVAIPQTPTPTKDKTPRTRFSHRGLERDVEREENPRSPTPPPPPVVTRKKEKNSCADLESASEAKRLRLSHDLDNRDENNRNVNERFNPSNGTSLKSVERQGNCSRKVVENVKLADDGIEAYQRTPANRGGSSSVATTGKRSKSAIYAHSAVLRECSSQPSKEKSHGSPFPQKKSWILVASGINRASEMPLVEEFVRKLGCRFLQKFTNGTTHVLVKPVKEGSRRCQRTLKYFQGIAHRSWVISIEWILDSIRMGCLQSEDKYEITGDVAVNEDHFGPTNARLSGVQLLRKFEICCLGAFDDLTRDELRGLAEACGASSLQDPAMFSFDVDRAQVIIVEGSSSDTGLQHFKKLYKKFSVPIVAKEWLLDSIGTYDVKSLDEYSIYPPLPS